MVVTSLRKVKPKIWIPPIYTTNYKVTVERSDGTIDDITDILLSLKIEDTVTTGIGTFEFRIPNPNETYSSVWTGMEIFRYYSDYSDTASTLMFRGRIEKPSKQNNEVLVTGRSESLFVQDQIINKNYVDKDVGYIVKDLFDTYGQSRYDTTSINTSTGVTLTISLLGTPFWDAIEAVCQGTGYDCHIPADLVVRFFEQGSIINENEGIVHDYNLIEVSDFAPDLQFVKNKVRVSGGNIDGVQIIYTSNDNASQSLYGVRRESVEDDGITTIAAAKELADFILAEKKNPPVIGQVKGLLLATLLPGEKIRLSSPMENLAPGSYRVISLMHNIDDQGLYTTVTINKEPRTISHVLKDRIQREYKKSGSSGNSDDLDYSDIELFNEDIGTKSGTEVVGGVLKLIDGETSGTWVSPEYGPDDGRTFESFKVDLVGDNLPGATIEITYNGGISYQTLERGVLVSLGIGEAVQVILTLTESTQIDSLVVQYSMTT